MYRYPIVLVRSCSLVDAVQWWFIRLDQSTNLMWAKHFLPSDPEFSYNYPVYLSAWLREDGGQIFCSLDYCGRVTSFLIIERCTSRVSRKGQLKRYPYNRRTQNGTVRPCETIRSECITSRNNSLLFFSLSGAWGQRQYKYSARISVRTENLSVLICWRLACDVCQSDCALLLRYDGFVPLHNAADCWSISQSAYEYQQQMCTRLFNLLSMWQCARWQRMCDLPLSTLQCLHWTTSQCSSSSSDKLQ